MKAPLSLRVKLTLGAVLVLVLALIVCCTLITTASRQVLENVSVLLTAKEDAALVEHFWDQLETMKTGADGSISQNVVRYVFGSLAAQADPGSTYVLQQGENHIFNNSGISPEALLESGGQGMIVNNLSLKTRLYAVDGIFYCVAGCSVDYFGDGYTVCVIRDVTEHMSKVQRLRAYCALIGGAVTIVAGLAIGMFLAMELRPLQDLQRNAKAIAEGEYTGRVEVSRKDELGQVSESFNIMAQAVQNHVAAVEATAQERSLLLHALAHEMRTPVTAISGYAYALRHMRMNQEQQEEALNFVEGESRRLERLYTKLTELITVADLEIPLCAIHSEQFESQILAILSPMAHKQGIHLEMDMGGSLFLGDMDLLVVLITNLYDNAKKAGAKSIKIRIENGVLSVKDDGCGMPKDIQDKIMQPFYQGDSSRNQEGFGLGLSLCRRIALLHGSDLAVESAPGKGSTFTIHLQLHDDSKTDR